MSWTWKKTALVAGGTVLGGAAIALTGGLAAPAIGGIVGNAMGLSGAAATSAGLAALGGGALAAGGRGMAAGTTAIVAAGGVLGSVVTLASTGLAAAILDDTQKCNTCNAPLQEEAEFCPQCGKGV